MVVGRTDMFSSSGGARQGDAMENRVFIIIIDANRVFIVVSPWWEKSAFPPFFV
jgi:hypothetical protein